MAAALRVVILELTVHQIGHVAYESRVRFGFLCGQRRLRCDRDRPYEHLPRSGLNQISRHARSQLCAQARRQSRSPEAERG